MFWVFRYQHNGPWTKSEWMHTSKEYAACVLKCMRNWCVYEHLLQTFLNLLLSTNILGHPASNKKRGMIPICCLHSSVPTYCPLSMSCSVSVHTQQMIALLLAANFWYLFRPDCTRLSCFLPYCCIFFVQLTYILTDHTPSQRTKMACRIWAVLLCKKNTD
jgi:hypothetical protein